MLFFVSTHESSNNNTFDTHNNKKQKAREGDLVRRLDEAAAQLGEERSGRERAEQDFSIM